MDNIFRSLNASLHCAKCFEESEGKHQKHSLCVTPHPHPTMFHLSSPFNDAVYIFWLHLGCILTTIRADTYQTWYVPEPSSMAGTLSSPPTSVAVSQWQRDTCQKLLNVCSFKQTAAQSWHFITCSWILDSKLYLLLYRQCQVWGLDFIMILRLTWTCWSINSNSLDINVFFIFFALSDKSLKIYGIIALRLNQAAHALRKSCLCTRSLIHIWTLTFFDQQFWQGNPSWYCQKRCLAAAVCHWLRGAA